MGSDYPSYTPFAPSNQIQRNLGKKTAFREIAKFFKGQDPKDLTKIEAEIYNVLLNEGVLAVETKTLVRIVLN